MDGWILGWMETSGIRVCVYMQAAPLKCVVAFCRCGDDSRTYVYDIYTHIYIYVLYRQAGRQADTRTHARYRRASVVTLTHARACKLVSGAR